MDSASSLWWGRSRMTCAGSWIRRTGAGECASRPDGGWHYFWKANWQVLKFGAGWIAARFADGKYVEALPEGGRCRNAKVAMRLADEAMDGADYAEVDG